MSKTVEVFNDIDEHVSGLTSNLDRIADGIKDIDSAKNETLMAIESISAVSQETASSTEEVNEAANRNLAAVEQLNAEAEELASNSEQLVDAINLFKI